jgi:hypothetical protein
MTSDGPAYHWHGERTGLTGRRDVCSLALIAATRTEMRGCRQTPGLRAPARDRLPGAQAPAELVGHHVPRHAGNTDAAAILEELEQ